MGGRAGRGELLKSWFRSVIATLGSLVGVNVIDNLLDVLHGVRPSKVLFSSLGFLIKQLGGFELCLELGGVIDGAEANSELLNLRLAVGEVVNEPHESLVVALHGSQHALRRITHYTNWSS